MRKRGSVSPGGFLRKGVVCGGAWALLLVGCAPDEETAQPTTAFTYCDAEVIIADKCVRCHSVDGDVEAPFSLTSYEDVSGRATSILRVVRNGSMPFVELDLEPEVEPLSAAEKELLMEWLEAGAPEGEGSCE